LGEGFLGGLRRKKWKEKKRNHAIQARSASVQQKVNWAKTVEKRGTAAVVMPDANAEGGGPTSKVAGPGESGSPDMLAGPGE